MKNRIVKSALAALPLLFWVATAEAACYQWSFTASANATADSSINWSEGQSPSSINDSARSMMARLAECRADISGALTTTGTGTALVLATNQVFDTTPHMDKAMLAFVVNVTNTGPVTLAVDGLTAKPIRTQTGSTGNLGAGVLVAGTPYIVSYYDTAGEFILQGFTGQPYAVPLGSFLFHSVATAPNSNFVMPIGQAISRTTYAAYFAMVGTTFGVGDGVTTFNVPDMRSRLPLPLATMGGADPGRVTTAGSGVDGATVGAVGGAQNVTLDSTMIPSHTHGVTGNTGAGTAHNHRLLSGGAADVNVAILTTGSIARGLGGPNNASPSTGYATNDPGTGTSKLVEDESAHTHAISVTSAATGGGLAHNNMPPVLVLPMILRIQHHMDPEEWREFMGIPANDNELLREVM